MSSLLGIALVVDDINKGCNLAFRYPAPPSGMDHVSSFHKLSPALFAKLFRPKNALCNQSFELVIDDLRFVSHPVLVTLRAQVPAAAAAHGIAVTNAGVAGSSSSSSSGATTSVTGAATGATVPNGGSVTASNASATGGSIATINGGTASGNRNETTMFNIIFALEEDLSQLDEEDEEVVLRRRRSITAFRTVAAQLANGLLHEELRSGFVSKEVRELLYMRDELVQNERLVNASNGGGGGGITGGGGGGGGAGGGGVGNSSGTVGNHHHLHRKDGGGNNPDNANGGGVDVDPQTFIDVALGKSVLANDLKSVFHGLDESGTAHVVINRWVKLSLTLTDSVAVKMQNLRPYHTLLLLADEDKILDSLPADHSQQLRLLIEVANPLKSFQELALKTSIPIHQLFRLSAHLVYWGFGKVIDTITLRNIYQVNPQAKLRAQSALALEFRRKFAPHELSEVLSSFSGSRSISEYMKNLSNAKKTEYIHMLIWLLQQNFIVQLHRYVYFMIPTEGDHAPSEYAHQDSNGSFENNSYGSNQLSHHHSQMSHHSHSRNHSRNNSFLGIHPQTPPLGLLSDQHLQSESNFSLQSFMTSKASSIVTAAAKPQTQLQQLKPRLLQDAPAAVNSNPFALSAKEREYLDRIATTNPVYTLFKRLCVYFHGQYHLEEIMWRENVSRSELRTVLSTYQDIIVCCLHE